VPIRSMTLIRTRLPLIIGLSTGQVGRSEPVGPGRPLPAPNRSPLAGTLARRQLAACSRPFCFCRMGEVCHAGLLPQLRLLPPQRVAGSDQIAPLQYTIPDTARLLARSRRTVVEHSKLGKNPCIGVELPQPDDEIHPLTPE
jgi:hypothetical protein